LAQDWWADLIMTKCPQRNGSAKTVEAEEGEALDRQHIHSANPARVPSSTAAKILSANWVAT
jgi:hypothetical protein